MKINFNEDTVTIEEASFGNIKMSYSEFWRIVNKGTWLSIKQEVEEYLEESEDNSFINTNSEILNDAEKIENIIEDILDSRTSNETCDQIYNAIERYA